MNQNLPYESLIAQKMEQLPVPDRSAAIWADVLQHLDVPATGTPDNTIKKITGKGISTKMIWIGVGASCLIVIVLYLLLSKPKKAVIQPTQPVPQQVVPLPMQPLATPKVIQADSFKNTLVRSLPQVPVPVTTTPNDSIPVVAPPPVIILPPVKQDSVNTPANNIIVSPPPKPRSRFSGVKGITDSAYRLSNKSDSGK
jgi:hypothetical protein